LIRGSGGRQIEFKDLAFECWKYFRKLKFQKLIAVEINNIFKSKQSHRSIISVISIALL
jgi:hypothetical protein